MPMQETAPPEVLARPWGEYLSRGMGNVEVHEMSHVRVNAGVRFDIGIVGKAIERECCGRENEGAVTCYFPSRRP